MSMQEFIECHGCGASRFPNQCKDVFGHSLCPDCVSALLERLGHKELITGLAKSSLPFGEVNRMRRERARTYAGSEVEVG